MDHHPSSYRHTIFDSKYIVTVEDIHNSVFHYQRKPSDDTVYEFFTKTGKRKNLENFSVQKRLFLTLHKLGAHRTNE